MAQLDVSELFTDPEFVDEMYLVTRVAAVNSLGENFLNQSSCKTVGSVQPTDGPTMNRVPDALRNENLSSFWIQAPLADTSGCKYPSIIIFKGKRFQVKHVFDWTNWGAGFSEGLCVAENPS